VSQAIQAGRLDRSVLVVDGVPTIPDFEVADDEWKANTRKPARGANARLNHWKAKSAALAYRRQAGELVEGTEVVALLATAFSTLRTVWEDFPDKVDQALNLSLEDTTRLEELVCQTLHRSFEQLDALTGRFER
jgi:hypothetical protein